MQDKLAESVNLVKEQIQDTLSDGKFSGTVWRLKSCTFCSYSSNVAGSSKMKIIKFYARLQHLPRYLI